MAFKKTERAALYLRCTLFGPSGSGKTMTALRMAKGIADKLDRRIVFYRGGKGRITADYQNYPA
jgi:ABC-type sulfate/molybdate transport systems ATPase subunit